MMSRIAKLAGTALLWKTAQLGASQAISLARMLILARLLIPEDFGLMAIAMITIRTILSVTDFGMVPALVQRSDAEDHHYNVAWTVGFTRALLITGAVVAAAPVIAELFAEPRAIPIIRVLAFRPLIEATASIKMAKLTRDLQFRSLAFISLPSILVETMVAIVLASHIGVWALVAGALTGAATCVLMSYIFAPHRPRFCFDRAVARPLIRYGRWIFVTGVVAVSGSTVLQVVISRQLGAASLGLYYLAVRLAFLPSEVSGKVVGEVAFPVYARLQSNIQQSDHAFRAIFTGIAAMLFPVYALLIALAPALVQDVLGPRWAGTAPVIRILALVGLLGLFGDTVVPVLKGLGQPYKVAVLEAVQSFLIILLVWWLAGTYGLIGAASAWLPAIIISQLVAAVFLQQLLHRPFSGLASPTIGIGAASLAGAVIALGVDSLLPGLTGLVVAASLGLVTTGLVLWVFDRRFHLGFGRDVTRVFPQLSILSRLVSLKS